MSRASLPVLERPVRGFRGFSLTELMVVVGIMALLIVIAAPALNSMLDSNNLARGGQIITDQVNLARQTAASRNRPVEVRLIKVPSHSAKGYSALQLWMADDSGTNKELGPAILFPTAITAAESTALSKAVSALTKGTMESNAPLGANQPYVAFQVRPNGMVTPSQEMSDFFVTVVTSRSGDAADLPPNYVMVQVNPLTASPLIYRP